METNTLNTFKNEEITYDILFHRIDIEEIKDEKPVINIAQQHIPQGMQLKLPISISNVLLKSEITIKNAILSDFFKIFYRINGVEGQNGIFITDIVPSSADQNLTFSLELKDIPDGIHRLSLWICDDKGRKTKEFVSTFLVERESTENHVKFVPSTTELTDENVLLTIEFPQNAMVKQYKIGKYGEWAMYKDKEPLKLYVNNAIYARYFDFSGEISKESRFDVNNIAKNIFLKDCWEDKWI